MVNTSSYISILEFAKAHEVCLIAVSKTKPIETIKELYDLGQRDFGENKVQELVEKHEALPKDIRWHMIGHLQSNKVKYIAPFVHFIHAVDSFKLMKEINKRAGKENRKINVLLQLHIAQEESKFGMNKEELTDIINDDVFREMENIQLSGLMGMASFIDDEKQVKQEFDLLKNVFEELKSKDIAGDDFKEISMGMSGDYKIAIESGSTMIRIGSLLFGVRSY